MYKYCILICILLGTFFEAQSSHITGGEYTYTYLGNNIYRVNFYLYRDCKSGNPGALVNDNPSQFRIINLDNINSVVGDSLFAVEESIIPTGFNNSCLINPPPVCLNRLRYTFNVTLPPNSNGYVIAYQRCCRNESVNINNVGGGNVGATYYCTINPQFGPNNSCVFKNFPPQIICINNPLNYDDAATDIDGDSLSYSFCEAKDYFNQDVKPNFNAISAPPYPGVPYNPGYTAGNPIKGNPNLTIDPVTGIITGTPNVQGRFVVTICCTEWRNGVIINVNRRDFQFEVTNCSKAVVADIPLDNIRPNTYVVKCDGDFEVQFKNISKGGFSYFWDFGVDGISSDTSNLFEPTYTYPDTGIYKVKLVVNRGTTCQDSIIVDVLVFPNYSSDFKAVGLLCPGNTLEFIEVDTSSLVASSKWEWTFDDGTTSTLQNPTKAFANSGFYLVSLAASNANECYRKVTKLIEIPYVNVETSSDTIVLSNIPITLYASGASTYTWLPNQYIDDNTKEKPTFIFPEPGFYSYTIIGVTANGCIDTAYVNIQAVKDFVFYVPNAFSPNGDGVNDVFNIISAGNRKLNYFRIVNRYGQTVFSTTNFLQGWDGKHNGKLAEQGTYFWMAEVLDITGKIKTKKGDLTLLR